MKERAFVIAAFGDRRVQLQRLIKNIRTYSNLPIYILTDDIKRNAWKGIYLPKDNILWREVEPQWTGPRAGIRNSNFHKVDFALNHHYDSLCMLDDDMMIVNPDFVAGFGIAERFGVAVPTNPRVFNYYNLQGADVRKEDFDECVGTKMSMPALNFSPFFVYPHAGLTTNFLRELHRELKNVPCRGTVALVKAMWNSSISPVILPEQWCVCASNARHIKGYTELLGGRSVNIPAIMLHLGHDAVKEVYNVE